MRKLGYKIEDKHSGYIVFSCFFAFALIISIIISILTAEDIKSILEMIPGIGLFALFMFIILFIDDKKKDEIRKELINIKKKGKRVEGNIIKFNIYRERHGGEYHSHDTVTVEYTNPYTNKIEQFETPELLFDAHHNLGSKKCSVYILGDKVYVTDFIERRKGEENIWAQEDDYYKEIANLEKKEMPKIILGIVLLLLLWLGTVICIFIKE